MQCTFLSCAYSKSTAVDVTLIYEMVHVCFDVNFRRNTFLSCVCVHTLFCRLFSFLFSTFLFSTVLFLTEPVVVPAIDHFIGLNSLDNVTYTCTVSPSRSVVWEVGRSQIRSPDQFVDIENAGIFIYPSNTMSSMSNITISQMARESVNSSEIQVVCLSIQGISTIPGNTFRVVTFRE